jgi:hypothetical protein
MDAALPSRPAVPRTALPQAGVARREWGLVLLAVIAIKLAFLLADPDPRFFMGDSVVYLRTALEGVFPRDRSFVYGGLIWLTAVLPHSLHGLVAAQAAAGVVSAMLVFGIARALLQVRFPWAFGAALLVAVEPSQLFYERMVMAEAFGGVAWLALLGCVLAYARRGGLGWLLGAVLAGIVGISLRQNAIAVAIVMPVLLPWLRRRMMADAPDAPGGPGTAEAAAAARPTLRTVAAHTLLALLATALLHVGYRHLVGHFAHSPPGYVGMAGPFELGLVVPLVRLEHFAGTGCPPDILQRVHPPISDPWLRELHIWRGDGLWPTMQWSCRDPEDAARVVADRALRSNPLGLLSMAASTLRQHFDAPSARWRMDSDLGRNWLGNDFIATIRASFGFDPKDVPFRDTITSRSFDASRWWLTAAYFVTPFYVAAMVRRARRRRDATALAFAASVGLLFASQLLASHILSYRYLYAFPVLLILAVAGWVAGPGSAGRIAMPEIRERA